MPPNYEKITLESIVKTEFDIVAFTNAGAYRFSLITLRALDTALKEAIGSGSEIARRNRSVFLEYLAIADPNVLTVG